MELSRKFALPFAIGAMLTSLTLSGCSAEAVAPATSPTKSAALLSKDVAVCISNLSGGDIMVDWSKALGISTYDSTGKLLDGGKFCAEGPSPDVPVTFTDGVNTRISSHNQAIGYPYVGFSSKVFRGSDKNHYWDSEWYYAQGEQFTHEVNGHQIRVTRGDDTDWINFGIVVLN